MPSAIEFTERPQSRHLVMLIGWRQWADAGSMSSGLPQYLIQRSDARRIGSLPPNGYYLFQIPGTHDLVRPVVNFVDGFPRSLKTPRNELFFSGNADDGVIYFLGDEPHLDVESYIGAILDAAQELGVSQIVGFGGVYGELPYDRERLVSCTYSLREMKSDLEALSVTLSDYQGGAAIGSYLCKRASERGMKYASFYAFVPTYDFSNFAEITSSIRIENDFTAWLAVMRRVNRYLDTRFDLSDLEEKSQRLHQMLDEKVDELDNVAPGSGLREYFAELGDAFTEMSFDDDDDTDDATLDDAPPLDDMWESALRHILDDDSAGAGPSRDDGDEPAPPPVG